MSSDKKASDSSWGVYRRLFKYTKPYRGRLVWGLICAALQGGATTGLILAFKVALGGISGEGFTLSGASLVDTPQGGVGDIGLMRLVLIVSILPLVTLLQGVALFAGKYLVEWVGNRVVADLRSLLFEHIHALPMQFFGKNRVGDLISRITSDTGLLTQLVSNVLGDLIREPFTLIGCIVAMFVLDWRLSIIALLVFPICIGPVALLGRRIRKASKGGQKTQGDMLSVVQESIGGALVVKAFQMEKEEARRFNVFNMRVFKFLMRQTRSNALSEPIMVSLSAVGLSAVVVYAYHNNLSLALLLAFGVAMVSMYKPAKKLSQIHMKVQKSTPGAERIFEILDIQNTIEDRPESISFSGAVTSVDFKDVSFAYDETDVLKNIDLNVRAGQCVAFVGSSGAGKTTIVNLIPRFYDVTGGCVCLNGKDIRDYTIASLRSLIGIVTQETILFNQSVAANIAYGSPDATREEVETAARRANAHEFISAMDEGYESIIGERGTKLSGGQAQRLAIARALLKNPPILILDEATSALDTESERLVQGALDELMKERTVFVIAHRLSTIIHADNIVVLDQGRVAEQGSHAELLALGGKYKYFHGIQFADKKES